MLAHILVLLFTGSLAQSIIAKDDTYSVIQNTPTCLDVMTNDNVTTTPTTYVLQSTNTSQGGWSMLNAKFHLAKSSGVIFEAENYITFNDAGTIYPSNVWEYTTDYVNISGGALRVFGIIGQEHSAGDTDYGRIVSYNIAFPSPGNYTMWARGRSCVNCTSGIGCSYCTDPTKDNTVHVLAYTANGTLDFVTQGAGNAIRGFDKVAPYGWLWDSSKVNLSVAANEVYPNHIKRFSVAVKDDGFVLDRLALLPSPYVSLTSTWGGTIGNESSPYINCTANQVLYIPPSSSFQGLDTLSYTITNGDSSSTATLYLYVGIPVPSASPSVSASASVSASPSVSATASFSASASVSVTPTPSVTPTLSPSRTTSASASRNPSSSVPSTPSPSVLPSASPSSGQSPSVSPTNSPSASHSHSASPSSGQSHSASPSTSPSGSKSPATSNSSTASAVPSATSNPSLSSSSTVSPSIAASADPSEEPSSDSSGSSSNSTTIYVASFLAAAAVLGIGIIALVIFRKQNAKKHPDENSDMELQKVPTADSKWEIDFNELTIGNQIGSGAFGNVFKARWRNCDCVVKQLNSANQDSESVATFLKEANIVKNLRNHENVCTIFGVCTNPEYPICIVLEYVAGGSLQNLLYEKKIAMTGPLLFQFAKNICSGMSHIHMENLLHCDLACRNLLIAPQGSNKYLLKITDFGLARISDKGFYNAKEEAKFPIRWTAPEVLTTFKVSRASDVWSFGVVLWEMISARVPWYNYHNNEVMDLVCNQHQHLPKPNSTFEYPADETYAIMVQCWQTDPALRPTFDELFQKLEKLESLWGYNQDHGSEFTTSNAQSELNSSNSNGSGQYTKIKKLGNLSVESNITYGNKDSD